jgi:hypothetical protein
MRLTLIPASWRGQRELIPGLLFNRNGSWLAARCAARDDLLNDDEISAYRQGADDHRFRQRPSRLRFAHTSPIYFTVDGQAPAVAGSIREGLLMLEHFERYHRGQADQQYIHRVAKAIERARTKLRSRRE